MPDTILHTASPLLVMHAPEFRPSVDDSGWFPWTSHTGWVLETASSPGIRYRVRAGSRTVPESTWQTGDWHLYAPGAEYRTGYDDPGRAHLCAWVVFPHDYPMPPMMPGWFGVFRDVSGVILSSVAEMYRAQELRRPGADWTLHGTLLRILGLLAEATYSTADGSPDSPWPVEPDAKDRPAQDSLLATFDREVLSALRHPPNVASLAERLAMSPSSLMHRMREHTGWSVVERARWLRIREARRMLSSGAARSIKQAAHALGFSSPQYFARVFREVTGLSPQEFMARVSPHAAAGRIRGSTTR